MASWMDTLSHHHHHPLLPAPAPRSNNPHYPSYGIHLPVSLMVVMSGDDGSGVGEGRMDSSSVWISGVVWVSDKRVDVDCGIGGMDGCMDDSEIGIGSIGTVITCESNGFKEIGE